MDATIRWPNQRGSLKFSSAIVIGLVLTLASFFSAGSALAKQFTDTLTTDFQGGVEDNIQINQGIQGGLQLAPYTLLGSWSSSTGPTNSIYLASATVYNGKLYVSGGMGSADNFSTGPTIDTALSTIHFANIQGDGTLDKWDPDKLVTLPQPTYGHASTVINGRMYIIGGRTANSSTLDSVYWGKVFGYNGDIQALYTPNTWNAVASLPQPRFRPAAVKFESWLYVIGGQDSSNLAQSTVYYTAVQPNGDIPAGSWKTTSAPLPTPLSGHSALVSNGRIYIIGGSVSGQPQGVTSQVYIGAINTNGDITSWPATAALPSTIYDGSAAIAAGKIWVCGGCTSGTAVATSLVYSAGIKSDGTIAPATQQDTWTRGTDLPVPVKWHNLVAFNGHLILTGGTNNAGPQKQIYTAALIADRQNITRWTPATPLFLSPFGGSQYDTWTGHTAVIKLPLLNQSAGSTSTSTQPTIYVAGGGPNTYNAYADGKINSATPFAYQTLYNANIDSNGAIQTWSADPTKGQIPMASILHTSVVALNNQIYVMGGVNSTNAWILAGDASRSNTAFFDVPNTFTGAAMPAWWHIGQADVTFENIASGSSSGTMDVTSPIPIRDPAWLNDPVGATVYQPLVRAASVANNDVIYVLGGVSRTNTGPKLTPTGSVPNYERRVWYCRPNPGGSINPEAAPGVPGPGGWTTTVLSLLPVGLYDLDACVANGRVYAIGGRNAAGTPQSTVYFANINNSDGSLGSWTATSALPLALAEHAVAFTSGRIYVLGGSANPTGGALQNTVYYCIPDPVSGIIPAAGYGAWTLSNTQLEQGVAGHSIVTNNGYLYLLGGRFAAPHLSSAYMSAVTDIGYADANVQAYAWQGTFERYIDLDHDLFIDNLDWLGNNNLETLNIKCRYALDRGHWSDWTTPQTAGPILNRIVARYIHYKVSLHTGTNTPGIARTPLVTKLLLNYTGGKQIDEDTLMVNHNKFDPQTGQLLISFKTRDNEVSKVILRVYNLEGELIRKQEFDYPNGTPLPTSGSWSWDGTNDNGELVANGVYVIQYNCGDTHKIRKVIVFKK